MRRESEEENGKRKQGRDEEKRCNRKGERDENKERRENMKWKTGREKVDVMCSVFEQEIQARDLHNCISFQLPLIFLSNRNRLMSS